MFSWLKRNRRGASSAPPVEVRRVGENPANPGIASAATWTFSNAGRTWEERMDLVRTLSLLLRECGRDVAAADGAVIDRESQLSLRPLLQALEPVPDAGVKTVTTIEVKHPSRIPFPIFEYQHASGAGLEESLTAGFRQWHDGDFAALRDAVRERAVECNEMLAAIDAAPASLRRITLGPVLQYREQQPANDDTGAGHAFCPCCLLTNSMDAFRRLLHAADFYALRLFAMRGPDGRIDADCRVNGEDHAEGKAALIRYAEGWVHAGVEFRKQYVLIQNAG